MHTTTLNVCLFVCVCVCVKLLYIILIVTKLHNSTYLHIFSFSLTMIPFVFKCESAYLLTQFPLSEGLVSIKHIRIILQSLLTQEQRHCSIILSEQQHHSLLSIQYLIMCTPLGHFEYKKELMLLLYHVSYILY